MIYSIINSAINLFYPRQNLPLELSDVQKVSQSILKAISSLSSHITQQGHDARSFDVLAIYPFISQLRQEFFVLGFQDILKALDDFAGRKDNLIEQAAKVSSSAISVLGGPESLLASLDAAVAYCRKKEDYAHEYLIRKLFASLSFLKPTASKEEIQRAIEIEQEHLECVSLFKNLPGSDQEKYEEHFENYFRLLSKFFDFTILKKDLKDKFIEVLEKLNLCFLEEKNKVSFQRYFLLSQQRAFLLSRPEWFFHRNGPIARLLLLEARERAAEKSAKAKAELELLLLESQQEIKYEKASKSLLESLNKRAGSVSLSGDLSASDHIIALSIRIRLYEALAKEAKKPEDFINKILSDFQLATQISKGKKEQLNFRALQALAYCRFTFGFYACLCFNKQSQLEKGLQALQAVSKDFGASEKIKQATFDLLECLDSFNNFPHKISISKEKFQLLNKFKLFLTQNIYKLSEFYFYRKELNCGNLIDILENKKDIGSFGSFLRQEFLPSFFSNNLERVNNIFKTCFAFYAKNALNRLERQGYITANQVNLDSFYEDTHQNIDNKLIVGDTYVNLQTHGVISQRKILDFISLAKDFPLMTHYWSLYLSRLLDNHSLLVRRPSLNDKKEKRSFVSSLVAFDDFFTSSRQALEECQGKLAYTEVIQETMHDHIIDIFGNNLLTTVFSVDLKHLGAEAHKAILSIRHYPHLMERLGHIWVQAYRHMDCHLPLHHEDYDYLFEKTMVIIETEIVLSQLDPSKICFWCNTGIQIAHSRRMSLKDRASMNRIQDAHIAYLYAQAIRVNFMENGEEKLDLLEEIFADVPDSEEEINKILLSGRDDISFRTKDRLFFVKMIKSFHLIINQQVEAGTALFAKVLDSTTLSSEDKSRTRSAIGSNCYLKLQMVSPLIPENLFREDGSSIPFKNIFPFNQKMTDSSKTVIENSQEKLPVSQNRQQESQDREEPFVSSHVSEKKEILDQSHQALQRQEEKKKKKEAKNVSSPLQTNSERTETLTTTSCTTLTHSVTAKKSLSKKAKKLFDLLWQENAPSYTSWEDKSFRNDIKMTRQEALQLIEALGGRYIPKRGHGSHHVAHLPKIEFNNQDMGGLIDFEKGELMITLTSDEELKSYQIKQLRRILIKQGFTPDTVD